MNNQQLYLAWLRTFAPDVYTSAMLKTFKKPRSLGGLNADLVHSMTAPATFGSFGQDSSSDSSFYVDPGAYVPPDAALPMDYTPPPLPVVTEEQLTAVTPITDTGGMNVPAVIETPPTTATNPATGQSWFQTFATAVASVASTALVASNQSNLVKLNTQRAQQGLVPLDQYGRPVQQSMLAPATGTIQRLEHAISGGAMAGGGWLLPVAGLGLLAFFFMRRR